MLLDKPCVILEMPDGDRRLVVSGVPYRLRVGEKVVGVDRSCGSAKVEYVKPQSDVQITKDELDAAIGPGVGDWVKLLAKPMAKLAGKANCTACEARRITLNAAGQLRQKHGVLKTASIITELTQMSLREEPDVVLAKLKTYL